MTAQDRSPFQALDYEISCRSGARLTLRPIDAELAQSIAAKIVEIDPWRSLGISAAGFSASLVHEDPALFRRAIWLDGACVGVLSIRNPWLYGPYLALLAILPGHQGAGIGSAILQWMETEAQGSARNIWACVSSFNSRAQRFYREHGFEEAGTLPDLLTSGLSEVLIRKRLHRPPGG